MVRNSKSKIRRTANNYGIDLSDEVELPSINNFKTRSQFNEWKEKQQSFTNRSNLNYQFKKNRYDVVASKSTLNQIEMNTRIAQRLADQKRKQLANKPFISGGRQQGTVEQRMLQMGRPNVAGYSRPKDFNFERVRNERDLDRIFDNIKKKADPENYNDRMEKMRENYIRKLEEDFNSDANDLIDKIKSMPADEFYEMYLIHDEFDFDAFYTNDDLMGDGSEKLIKVLERYVDNYFLGNTNMDLKGFPNK